MITNGLVCTSIAGPPSFVHFYGLMETAVHTDIDATEANLPVRLFHSPLLLWLRGGGGTYLANSPLLASRLTAPGSHAARKPRSKPGAVASSHSVNIDYEHRLVN